MRLGSGTLRGVVAAVVLCGAFLASTEGAAAATYSSVVLADGPVGYWRFGGPAGSTAMTDSSPSNNTGTLLNGVALGQAGALSNDPDTAASFDGVNDSGRVPDANSLDVGSVFSVEGWIRRSTTTKSYELMNKGGNGIQLVVMSAGNGNEVWIRKANVSTIARSSAPIPADGKYHHVVATMNGLGPATIYVDGQPGTITVTPNQAIQNTTFPLTVGGAGTAQAYYDEFAIYPRPLAAAEVLEHFQTGTDIPPTAVADTATVVEDSGASAIDVLANDTDPDGGPKSIASVTQPANGTVVITGGGTGLTYAPNANYCNAPPGTTPDTFTYTLTPGGSTATVSVTVTCVDDPPVAVNDSATVSEDAGASAVAVLANDTDVDGGPKSIASVTQPANGTVVITGGGTGLSYQPNAQYCNSGGPPAPDTFTYTLTPGGSTATVSMTVTCVPDAPFVDTTAGALAYTENDPATPVDPGVIVTDADVGGLIASATVQITGNYAGAQDVLALSNPVTHPLITAMFVGDTLTLTGSASPAAYQSALRDVTYVNTSEAPSPLTRTVTFTATDTTALSGSDTRAIVVTAVDDNPSAVDDSATVAEDSGPSAVNVRANDTDPDGGPKSIASVTQPANGTVVIVGGGTVLTYAPNANYCNAPPGTTPDTFTYTLSPGGSSATVSMTVTCVDDPPVAVDDVKTVAQDSGVNAVDVLANDTDVDGGPKSVTSVTQPANGSVVITGGGTGVSYAPNAGYCNSGGPPAPDTFTYTLTPGGSSATVSVTVTCLDIPPVAVDDDFVVVEDSGATAIDVLANDSNPDGGPMSIASVTQPTNGTVVITGGGTGLTYAPNANYCNSGPPPPDTFTYTLTPAGPTPTATVSMGVTCVDDPPVAVDDAKTVLEDSGATAVPVLANDTDFDGGPKSIASVTQPTNGAVVITGGGTGLTYQPAPNYCNDPPGTTPDTFTYTLTPGGSSATVSMTVTCVDDAPTAVADSFDVIGNTGLFVGTTRPANQAGKEIAGSLLDNDTDPDTPHANLVAEPVTNAPTTQGGTITIESDGNFTYNPDDVDTGITDTFTYRVCDASPCNSGTVANSTGTLSLPIAGQVWYVRNNEPAGGDGTSDTPFDTLAEAEAASGTGDTTYVFDGNNTTTNLDTGYAMNSGERLIGESRPLSLDPDGGGPLPTASLFPGTSGAQPTLTASNEDVIVLASDVLVDGVDVDPSGSGGGISGGAGTSDVTVQNVNVTDTGTAGTQPGIEMDGTTGVNRFTGVTVTNGGSATAIGVRINNADRVLFSNTATNTIATAGAKALDVASTSLLTSRWNDITVTGSGTGAIRLNSTSGQPDLGDGAGTDLSLQTTSGSTAALDIASSNTVTVDSSGTDTISATGGPAMDIRNSNGSSFTFDSVSSTNSAGDGINLDTNLTSPVVINAGAISGAAGIALDVNGGGVGGGGVVYAGAINDGSGQSVEVTGRDGGGVTRVGQHRRRRRRRRRHRRERQLRGHDDVLRRLEGPQHRCGQRRRAQRERQSGERASRLLHERRLGYRYDERRGADCGQRHADGRRHRQLDQDGHRHRPQRRFGGDHRRRPQVRLDLVQRGRQRHPAQLDRHRRRPERDRHRDPGLRRDDPELDGRGRRADERDRRQPRPNGDLERRRRRHPCDDGQRCRPRRQRRHEQRQQSCGWCGGARPGLPQRDGHTGDPAHDGVGLG